MSTILRFEHLGYRYGSKWALRDATGLLRMGITGLLGPNGAGKTTLMRLAMGLFSPHEGSVALLGRDPSRHPEQRLYAGYLPQVFDPPRYMRVADYVQCLALLAGCNRKEVGAAVDRSLDAVGLVDQRRSLIGSLSGGMIRRVGLAQALAHQPEVLILDEPVAGLDPEERIRLYSALRQEASTRPVLVSSHLVDEIEREADCVWMMCEGKLVWAGTVKEALQSFKGCVREGVLPSPNKPNGHVVFSRPASEGRLWRIIGGDERLAVCEPSLLDVYMHYVGCATS